MAMKQQDGSNHSILESRIAVLEELFVRLAQAGATETILGYGFEQVSDRLKTVSDSLDNIANQVAPLRHLSPAQPEWRPEQNTVMQNLYAALVPPEPIAVKSITLVEQGPVGARKRSALP